MLCEDDDVRQYEIEGPGAKKTYETCSGRFSAAHFLAAGFKSAAATNIARGTLAASYGECSRLDMYLQGL
jgi:hypothetical protein